MRLPGFPGACGTYAVQAFHDENCDFRPQTPQEGFATLALAYWQSPGLPPTLENIPLEYFDRAVSWLQQQPRVAAGGIGMLGWSRGSEAALLTAVRNPQIHAVVGVAPSGVVWPGLSFKGHTAPGPASGRAV